LWQRIRDDIFCQGLSGYNRSQVPSYKDHPRWIEAIRLTEVSYAAAGRLRASRPAAARRLRKTAVAIPASLAEMLAAPEPQVRSEAFLRVLEALAELRRQIEAIGDFLPPEEADAVRRAAADLAGALRFEFGGPAPHSDRE
jgi:hypothetical protein